MILLGEFGDLTQVLTVGFVAHTHDPAAVALGAAVALVTVASVAAFSGRALARVVRTSVLRRAGGVVLAVLTAVSIAQLAGA